MQVKPMYAFLLIALHWMIGCAGPAPESNALQFAFISDKSKIPAETKKALEPIIGKYFT